MIRTSRTRRTPAVASIALLAALVLAAASPLPALALAETEPNDSMTTASGPCPNGEDMSGDLSSTSDYDHAYFYLREPCTVDFSYLFISRGSSGPTMKGFRDVNGTQPQMFTLMTAPYGSGQRSKLSKALPAGLYYLQFRDWSTMTYGGSSMQGGSWFVTLTGSGLSSGPANPTVTIRTSTARSAYPKPFVLSGILNGGQLHDWVVVEVKRPGSARWSYSSARLVYRADGAWWYRYTPKLRGTYAFRARFGGMPSGKVPYSPVVSVSVR